MFYVDILAFHLEIILVHHFEVSLVIASHISMKTVKNEISTILAL